MMSIRKLSPKVAADLFLEDPEAVLLSFDSFMEFFDVTGEEMLKDLQSGKLVAVLAEGKPYITGKHAVEWMEIRHLPAVVETEH